VVTSVILCKIWGPLFYPTLLRECNVIIEVIKKFLIGYILGTEISLPFSHGFHMFIFLASLIQMT